MPFRQFINYYAAVDSQSVACVGIGGRAMDGRSVFECVSHVATHMRLRLTWIEFGLRFVRNIVRTMYQCECVLTKWSTVLTTSRFDTWPTSISPMSTANFRLSVIDILTTSSGRFMSLYGGRVKSAIFTDFSSFIYSFDVTKFEFNLPTYGLKIINVILSINIAEWRTHRNAHTYTTHNVYQYFHLVFVVVVTLNGFVCMNFFVPFIHFIQSPVWRFR